MTPTGVTWRWLLLLAAAFFCTTTRANSALLEPLLRNLQAPEAEIDFAEAKLAIDLLIDPNTDASNTLRHLDAMAARVRQEIPPHANQREILLALLGYMYTPSPSNDFRVFSYDLDDPFGKNIRNKLLATYLETRKGNCVSMPTLFVALAQKIGLDAVLATAPEHIFAKVRDDNGDWLTIEATSGGTKSDQSYKQEMEISDLALANGIYLRALSKRESVAVMASTVMEHYRQENRQDLRDQVATAILSVDPHNVTAMLHKGSAALQLAKQRYLDRYPRLSDMPSDQRRNAEQLLRENLDWFAKAEALGWREPSVAQNIIYQHTVQQAKFPKARGH
jgi:regulator of sirC expression with transglutaminase-like and TPR domain